MVAVSLKKDFFQAEDGIRDLGWSRGLGDVYKRQVLRTGEILDLQLSKSGSGIWAPFPLSMDQNMEGWTNFYLSKTSKKGPYLTRGRK